MLQPLAVFLLSASAVVAAGIRLTRDADRIAELTGLGRLLIGTVLLAFLTSLPEVSVGISAARQGHPDIAVGNVVGSSLMNLFILGLLDLTIWSRGRILSRQAGAHALSATMSGILTALAGVALVAQPGFDLGPMGLGSLAILVAWILGVRLVFYDERLAANLEPEGSEARREFSIRKAPRRPLVRASLACLFSALVILVAAPIVSSSAADLAAATGMGDTFVGTVFVAIATSLPEATTCLAAVRMGAYDLAAGNVFGSNGFNMVILAPVDFFSEGALLSSASPIHAQTCFWAIVATGVAVIGLLYRVERRRPFLEPDAWLVLLVVLLGLASTWGS